MPHSEDIARAMSEKLTRREAIIAAASIAAAAALPVPAAFPDKEAFFTQAPHANGAGSRLNRG
jgi:hypothetical protein